MNKQSNDVARDRLLMSQIGNLLEGFHNISDISSTHNSTLNTSTIDQLIHLPLEAHIRNSLDIQENRLEPPRIHTDLGSVDIGSSCFITQQSPAKASQPSPAKASPSSHISKNMINPGSPISKPMVKPNPMNIRSYTTLGLRGPNHMKTTRSSSITTATAAASMPSTNMSNVSIIPIQRKNAASVNSSANIMETSQLSIFKSPGVRQSSHNRNLYNHYKCTWVPESKVRNPKPNKYDIPHQNTGVLNFYRKMNAMLYQASS